jgi:hypothetical protein
MDFDAITVVVAQPRRKERPGAAAFRPLLLLQPAEAWAPTLQTGAMPRFS